MARFQNGWLQKKPRKSGDIWVFCYRRQRPEDGAWVQATSIKVGKVREYPSEEAAWRRVEELHLNPNQSPFEVGAQLLFGELAAHYIQRELPEDQRQATIEKAYSTIRKYKRYLSRWALPRWGATPALAVQPPEVEDWLRELKNKFALRNPTLGEIRKAMNNVYVHGQRQGFLPRTPDGNPIGFVRQSLVSDFEPVILTLPQVLDILDTLDLMHRTMVITDAATALRVSEGPGPPVVRFGFHGPAYPGTAGLCRTPFRPAQVEGIQSSCANASAAGCASSGLEKGDALPQRRRPGVSQSSFERDQATCSEHAGCGLLESSGEKGRGDRATPYLRLSHLPENAGIGAGENESGCQDGAGDSAAPKLENDSRNLCQVDAGRQAECPGNVP